MADLEEWGDGEALIQFCAQTGKGLVGEKDITLDLSCNGIHSAGIAETQCLPSLSQSAVEIQERVE